jgi:protein TonB
LVVVAFVVGTFVHGFEPGEVKAAPPKNAAPATPAPQAPRSRVTLVPVTSDDVPPSIEQPITSAPPKAPGQQPNDATALPANAYAAAAARAKAQREEEKAKPAIVDPRLFTGQSSASAERPAKRESKSIGIRTRPVLEYQPVPSLQVDRDTTARLNLTVGADGRVKDINVSQSIPEMHELMAMVQSWRFKPATENGVPVASNFSVEITFHANE